MVGATARVALGPAHHPAPLNRMHPRMVGATLAVVLETITLMVSSPNPYMVGATLAVALETITLGSAVALVIGRRD